ncbi:MAG: hypothetical protein U0228_19200 [Myxococcaceae bacterium]
MPTIGGNLEDKKEKAPYHGSAVSYGHQLTAYNPTPEVVAWSQRIGLTPEFHFSKPVYVRGRLYLSQELTLSDTTTRPHEIELSDLWVDFVWTGWKEQFTGLRVAGDLRTTLPTSKGSQAASRWFTLGPSLNVSRNFEVLAGLSLVYSARFTWRFNQYAVRQNQGGLITNCPGLGLPEACINTATGARNVQADMLHGPTVSFSPHERFNLSATFLMQHAWLSPLSSVPAQFANVPELQNPQNTVNTRDFVAFSFGATYTPWDVVSFTLGAFTFSNQLDTTGQYIFPLFNRNTVVSLDATFDIEAAVSSFTKEKS